MNRPRGRPSRQSAIVSRDDMLTIALDLLGSTGVGGFTMRALAARLQVNPMTIYHHFGDRDGLIAAMADRVYSGIIEPADGTFRSRIEGLLQAYYTEVLRHADLALLIFGNPAAFPNQARRITNAIARLLVSAGMTPSKSRLWVGILIDFTHGAAIAVAMASRSEAGKAGLEDYDYAQALCELMNCLEI